MAQGTWLLPDLSSSWRRRPAHSLLPVPPPQEPKSCQRSGCRRGWGTCRGPGRQCQGWQGRRDDTHFGKMSPRPVESVPWAGTPASSRLQTPPLQKPETDRATPSPSPPALASCPQGPLPFALPGKDSDCGDRLRGLATATVPSAWVGTVQPRDPQDVTPAPVLTGTWLAAG